MAGGGGAKGGAGGAETEMTLEYTPTWIVASVCSVIVLISLLFERMLHRLVKGVVYSYEQNLKKSNQKPMFEALLKVKEELMLLGFISLLLTVFQGLTQNICVRESLMHDWLPCKREPAAAATMAGYSTAVFSGVLSSARRLLASGGTSDNCQRKGKVPILTVEAMHQLHIFICLGSHSCGSQCYRSDSSNNLNLSKITSKVTVDVQQCLIGCVLSSSNSMGQLLRKTTRR